MKIALLPIQKSTLVDIQLTRLTLTDIQLNQHTPTATHLGRHIRIAIHLGRRTPIATPSILRTPTAIQVAAQVVVLNLIENHRLAVRTEIVLYQVISSIFN